MAASFASRLSNLRQKKAGQAQQDGAQLRLTLPPDASDKSTYQPSKAFNSTRTSFRLLKGRIEKGQSTQKQDSTSNNLIKDQKPPLGMQKLSLYEQNKESLKLTLNIDQPSQDKKIAIQQPKVPMPRRIMIAKQALKQEIKPQISQKQVKIQKKEQPKIVQQQQRPIREQQAEETLPPQSELDLILCPQGCGRKFNRKALQKHAKACKLVFMSKRKEFNSEAKRFTSKEQENLVKKTKLQQKKRKNMGATRKGFEKTGDNWKAASDNLRSAIKAKKQQIKDKDDNQDQQGNLDQLIENNRIEGTQALNE